MKKILCKKPVHIWLRLGIRKDGSSDYAKIVILVGLGQKRIGRLVITTLKVRPSDWDQTKGQIKPSAKSYIPEYKTYNNLLLKELLRKNDLAEELNSTGKASQWPTTRIMDSLRESAPVEIVNEFYTFSKLLADEMRDVQRFGNEKAYRQAVAFLAKVLPAPALFSDINYNLLKKLENFHLSNGHSLNGLSTYIRALRAIYNEGVRRLFNGKYPDGVNPFDMYKIRTTETRKRALKPDSVQKLFEVELPVGSPKWHYRNLWEFMLQARGMTAAEMARLKVEHVRDRVIEYVRVKTKNRRTMRVKVGDRMAEILNYYMQGKRPQDFIFHFIKHPDNPEKWNEDIANTRRYIKKAMNSIAAEAGVDANVTTYVARHTWAVLAMHQTADKHLIKQALGHESIKTTEIYLSSFDTDFVDDLQDSVTSALSSKTGRKKTKPDTIEKF